MNVSRSARYFSESTSLTQRFAVEMALLPSPLQIDPESELFRRLLAQFEK